METEEPWQDTEQQRMKHYIIHFQGQCVVDAPDKEQAIELTYDTLAGHADWDITAIEEQDAGCRQ